ncbi:MAG: tetratricopeptide repeat protein [Endomicrobiaceae bacterium]|nr:tetratricopeptide repeat protein [Endomicrobiaceae bacterium]
MKRLLGLIIISLFCFFSQIQAQNYQSCMDEGEAAVNMGEIDEGLDYFQEAMRYKNDDPAALYKIGKIYEDRGDIRQASEYYEKVLARSTHAQMTYDIGVFYLKIGNISRVEEIYTRAWRRKVNSIEANLGMGDYNFITKNYRKAMEFYEFVIERDQTRAIAYFRYAVCLDVMDKKEQALEMCQKAMRLDGSQEIKDYYNSLKKKR